MRVKIKGKEVKLADETGGFLIITLDQLLEMVRIINVSTRENGVLVFELLEFTV